jgi:hypothetical protein
MIEEQTMKTRLHANRPSTTAAWLLMAWVELGVCVAAESEFAFDQRPDRVIIMRGAEAVAEYVFRDARILRPHFANLHAPGGPIVTRRHPPVRGQDPVDHDTMHPGLWLAFGDINGHDYWRNKARVAHDKFLGPPRVENGRAIFTVVNGYLNTNGAAEVCRETACFTFLARPAGILLLWESELGSDDHDLVFLAQEEMGLGVRVASPLRVQGGSGTIRNSRGGTNGTGTWGKEAEWWDYSGVANNRRAGVLLAVSPANTFTSWGHTRDYGLMVANPFPLPEKNPVRTTIKKGEKLRLRYAVLLHASSAEAPFDAAALAADCLSFLKP